MKDCVIEIYVRENSEEKSLLYKTRGYRRDVFVKVREKFYRITVVSYTYLKQLLQNQYRLDKLYYPEANLIIVKSVTAKNIVATVLKQVELHYFDTLMACQVQNGTVMYPLDAQTKADYAEQKWPICVPVTQLIRLY